MQQTRHKYIYMKHFIYKTTHVNGKYYIGRHSTENINDGYIGSGKWPISIKDKSSLTREIIEFVDNDKSSESSIRCLEEFMLSTDKEIVLYL